MNINGPIIIGLLILFGILVFYRHQIWNRLRRRPRTTIIIPIQPRREQHPYDWKKREPMVWGSS